MSICQVCGVSAPPSMRCLSHLHVAEDDSAIRPGDVVTVRDAIGNEHEQTAASGVIAAYHSYFKKVWVYRDDPESAVPWPADHVWPARAVARAATQQENRP